MITWIKEKSKQVWGKIKDAGRWVKKKIKKIILVVLGVGVATTLAATVPIIPQEIEWVSSYETIGFDTPSGELEIGQYTVAEDGYYIRTKPKTEAQIEWVDSKYDVSGLEEVNVICEECVYYDEFLGLDGKTVRIKSDYDSYWNLSRIKNYPRPKKTELVPLLNAGDAEGAIAFDTTTNSTHKVSVSSYSWSHEATGSNLILVVGDSHVGSGVTVTGITFNSDALTFIRSDAEGNYRSTIYYRIAPDTGGSFTVEVTLSGTASSAVAGAVSYTGVAQTGQPDGSDGEVGNVGPTAAVNVTTVADNTWVFSVIVIDNETFLNSDETERWKFDGGDASNGGKGGSDTNGPKTPAGIHTMTWTFQASGIDWSISAASFAPAPPTVEEDVITPPVITFD